MDFSRCQRCSNVGAGMATTMSKFNTDIICMVCKERERKHPDYKRASDAELEAVRRGEMNFPGVGKPADL